MRYSRLVSIVIVAHNPGEYLRNTLLSCVEQTYRNLEILILDNACGEDISQYLPTSNIPITILRSETNLGPYRGLNFLLDRACGDYIAIQDHDDLWHPEKLEKQIDFLEKHPDFAGCGTTTIMCYEADNRHFKYFLGEKTYYALHPSLVFRNTSARYSEDGDYFADALFMKFGLCNGENKIFNLREPLTIHIIKGNGTNYSYRWYSPTWKNIKRAYSLHPPIYATLTIGWEIMRKILYPILNLLRLEKWINRIERIPFILTGTKILKD